MNRMPNAACALAGKMLYLNFIIVIEFFSHQSQTVFEKT